MPCRGAFRGIADPARGIRATRPLRPSADTYFVRGKNEHALPLTRKGLCCERVQLHRSGDLCQRVLPSLQEAVLAATRRRYVIGEAAIETDVYGGLWGTAGGNCLYEM